MPSDRESVRGLPVFMSRGCQDDMISIEQVRAAKPLLEACPVDLTYREYETMGHTIDAVCLADFKAWMEDCLPVRQPGFATLFPLTWHFVVYYGKMQQGLRLDSRSKPLL